MQKLNVRFRFFYMLCFFISVLLQISLYAKEYSCRVITGPNPSGLETYAAAELTKYLYQLFRMETEISSSYATDNRTTYILGTPQSNPHIQSLIKQDKISVTPENPGPQGYYLKRLSSDGQELFVIAANDEQGVLYGVYGLLDDHYNVGFYFSGDALPEPREFYLPDVDEIITPTLYIRGFLPWTNFPQSATVYSWADWKYIIDQTARMRMNFIHIHNYNGMCGHNEMYHNFYYGDFLSRVWMPTAETGHSWGYSGWQIREYRFGAYDLFDDYDFGSQCTLHNDSLSNEEVFRKGASLFRKVIDYAHTRGVKIGLGLDINLIPVDYTNRGAKADDPEIIRSRVEQIATDYPNLDYLLCFQSEGGGKDDKEAFHKAWQKMVFEFYTLMKEKSPNTHLAVSGWGLDPKAVEPLPPDIICAPISGYSDSFQPGSLFGNREYWGCPWMERDGSGSQHYYPYGTHLSNTIQAYRQRSDNTRGMYCLTWRLTDAIDPKMAYVAKAPWDHSGKYVDSHAVYHEYASRNYGTACADEITEIINENEPFANDLGECAHTPELTGTHYRSVSGTLYNIKDFTLKYKNGDTVLLNADNKSQMNRPLTVLEFRSEPYFGRIRRTAWVKYEQVDLTGLHKIEVQGASALSGGRVEFRVESETGKLIAVADVVPNGHWQLWQTYTADVEKEEGKKDLYVVFMPPYGNDLDKTHAQLATVDKWIEKSKNHSHQQRLQWLRCRIAAVRDFILLDNHFPHTSWNDLPGAFESWAQNFIYRVNDISSLGNVQSSQNRLVQLRYVSREKFLNAQEMIKPPVEVRARGTMDGAVITWENIQPSLKGFQVFRDGKLLTPEPISPDSREFTDTSDGNFTYQVRVVDLCNRSSRLSVPVKCAAGAADQSAPHLIVVSPPTSAVAGQPVEIKVRLLDNRAYDLQSAKIHHRPAGESKWSTTPMQRRTKAIFTASLQPQSTAAGFMEYYIEATDGNSTAYYPAHAPNQPAAVTLCPAEDNQAPPPPAGLKASGRKLTWKKGKGDVYWYKIYRSMDRDFEPSPATFVTYLDKDTLSFEDNGRGFDAHPLEGMYYYVITAVDAAGNESSQKTAAVKW